MGKVSIRDSNQMRVFSIQGPWALPQAEELGPEAAKEWEIENNSHLMDNPTDISQEAHEQLGELPGSVPLTRSPSRRKWDEVATNGDKFISTLGNLTGAAHCYASQCRKSSNPTTLTHCGLKIYKDLVDRDLFNYAYFLSSQGVLARSHATPCRFPKSPYPRYATIQSKH